MSFLLILNHIIIVLVASGNVIKIIYLSPETPLQPLLGNCKGISARSDPGPSTYFLFVIGPRDQTLSRSNIPYMYIPCAPISVLVVAPR